MKKVFVASIVAALVLVGSMGAVQAWGPGGEPGFGCPGGRMADLLQPSPEQMSQWKEMRGKFRGEILPLRSQLVARHLELKALMIQPDADLEAIQTKQKEVIALRTQIQEKAMAHQLAFRQTLSPEQIQTWGTWRADRSCRAYGSGHGCHGKGSSHMGMGPGSGMDRGCWSW